MIEDGPSPDTGRHEYPPGHPTALALTGRSAGDAVTLSDRGVQPQVLKVRAVVSKFVYRFMDCKDRYQTLFPGGSAIQVIHLGSGDDFDPSPLLNEIKSHGQRVEAIDRLYQSQPVPFTMYAKLVGRGELDAWTYLSSTPDLGIHSAGPDAASRLVAEDLAHARNTLVLDLTSLLTLAHLGMLNMLARGGARTFVVAQSLLEHLDELAEEAEGEIDVDSSTLVPHGTRFSFVENTAEQRSRRAEFFARLCDVVRAGCDVRPCLATARLDRERREGLTQVLGRPTLDSVLLAAEPGSALWTDDLVIGLIGATDFGAGRVWTQPVLSALLAEGIVTQQQYREAMAKLVAWNYPGVPVDGEILLAAAEAADWRMEAWPVPQAMRFLRNTFVPRQVRLGIAAGAIRAAWRRTDRDLERQAFLFAVLAGIGSVSEIGLLRSAIEAAFSDAPIAGLEVDGCVTIWLSVPTALLLP